MPLGSAIAADASRVKGKTPQCIIDGKTEDDIRKRVLTMMGELGTTDLIGLGITLVATVGFLWLGWQAVQALKQ